MRHKPDQIYSMPSVFLRNSAQTRANHIWKLSNEFCGICEAPRISRYALEAVAEMLTLSAGPTPTGRPMIRHRYYTNKTNTQTLMKDARMHVLWSHNKYRVCGSIEKQYGCEGLEKLKGKVQIRDEVEGSLNIRDICSLVLWMQVLSAEVV